MGADKSFSARDRTGLDGVQTVRSATAAAHDFASARLLEPEAEARLAILVEELVDNMFRHGNGAHVTSLALRFTHEGDAIALEMDDDGPAFDPRKAPLPARPPADGGGAGLALLRAWTDVIAYERTGGRNRLSLRLPLAHRPQGAP